MINEIADLSAKIGAQPIKTVTLRQNREGITAVISLWGEVTIEELDDVGLKAIEERRSPHVGFLVDYIGNFLESKKAYYPIYRITGGTGYVYAASFGGNIASHRHYVAVNPAKAATHQYDVDISGILGKDSSLREDDLSLWPEMAKLTRSLALATTVGTANQSLDRAFRNASSKKLFSHVWAAMPLGAINRLGKGVYSRLDVYGPKTDFPKIRAEMQSVLREGSVGRFGALADLVVGDFLTGLTAHGSSLTDPILNYASGYRILQEIGSDYIAALKASSTVIDDLRLLSQIDVLRHVDIEDVGSVNTMLSLINTYGDALEGNRVIQLVPNFLARSAQAINYFAAVVKQQGSPHADDAAYMMGWLTSEARDTNLAITYLEKAMTVRGQEGDYGYAAFHKIVQLIDHLPSNKQKDLILSNDVLSHKAPIWYSAARSAFRKFDYKSVDILTAEAFDRLGIPAERIPVTTDRGRIVSSLQQINPDLVNDLNVIELVYLAEAAKDIMQTEDFIASTAPLASTYIFRLREKILKYSLMHDQPERSTSRGQAVPLHKDLRQALHLMDAVLKSGRRSPEYASFREWTHYRKVRALAIFDPLKIPDAILDMRVEYPASQLIGNVLAEEIFAEGITLENPEKAKRTFERMLAEYPTSQAIDNAFSWMSIIMRCAGRDEESKSYSVAIMRKFPLTRHAAAARQRLASTSGPTDCH